MEILPFIARVWCNLFSVQYKKLVQYELVNTVHTNNKNVHRFEERSY